MFEPNVITESTYANMPILSNSGDGCYEDILGRLKFVFSAMLSKHQVVFFSRHSISTINHPYQPDNHCMVVFLNRFISRLNALNYDPMYAWTYSQPSQDLPQTYHLCLWLDGCKVSSLTQIVPMSEHFLGLALGSPASGLIVPSPVIENGIMIDKSCPDFMAQLNMAYEQASYLACVNVKRGAPYGVREFGSSMIAPR